MSEKIYHDEKVQRISRHIGGYLGLYARNFGLDDFRDFLPPESFPEEVWETIRFVKNGMNDRYVRRDPYLSYAFPLLLGEQTMIFWEITAQAPQIALYATGDLLYAQEVDDYLRRDRSKNA